MDMRFSDEDHAFRAELRAFLQQAWTPELAARVDDDAQFPQAIDASFGDADWHRRRFAELAEA